MLPLNPLPPETDPRLLEALASLNQIGNAINRIGSGDEVSSQVSLQLIVESAIRVVPGSSAVIYTYDQLRGEFESGSRVSAYPEGQAPDESKFPQDGPRPDGMGRRAILERRNVLSYEEASLGVHPHHAARGAQAVVCFPLVVADQTVGVLYVYLHEKREFARLELLLLDNFVNQAAMAIYHSRRLARIKRDLAKKEKALDQLNRAGMLISSRLRLEETLESILQLAMQVTDAHYGIFRLIDKSGKQLVTHTVAGEHLARPKIEALPMDSNSVMSWVARNRQPILIPDLRAEPWSKVYYPLDATMEMRSELAVPLINASGRLEGVLNLESPEVGGFDEDDRHTLQTLATYAVTAIQEVRLLDALQEVARLLFSKPYQKVLDHLAALACDLLNASASSIWVLHENELTAAASSGGPVTGNQVPLERSLTGQAILQKAPVISEDVRTDPRFHRPDLAQSQHWTRALIIPIMAGETETPLGAFGVYSSSDDPGRFAVSEWDKKVLTFLANYAVLAIQNEAHQQALRAAQEQRAVAETFAAVGDIASNLLHHLNNKVGIIPVRVQNIQDKSRAALETDLYLANNLAEIERCATEAMQTVRDNLSHLRPIRLEPVYIAARVNEAINTAHLPAAVRVQTEGLGPLPMVLAGGQSLTFVFANLFENAADAMSGDGIIVVRGTVGPDWVEVTVSDSGPGIPPELHDRIFELNFSGRARPGKLGFGLWWVKTLMTRLNGAIAIESDGQRGTTFRLRLPRTEDKK